MNKVKVHTVLIVLVLASVFTFDNAFVLITGNVVGEDNLRNFLSNLDEATILINSNIDRLPNFVKNIFGNEKVNVEIKMNDGSTLVLGVETAEGKVIKLFKGEIDDPTLKVEVSEDVLTSIANSRDPVNGFISALSSDQIKYESLRAKTSIKTGIGRLTAKLFSFFR